MAEYRIQGETLTSFADQTRRLAGVQGGLSPAQMLGLLGGIDSTRTLTAAENSNFGTVEQQTERGILTYGSYADGGSGTFGYKFTPNEDISVCGIWARATTNNSYAYYCSYIWDEDGKPLATVSLPLSTSGASVMFNSPINLIAGKTYVVAAALNGKTSWRYTNGTVTNSKITFITSVKSSERTTETTRTNFTQDYSTALIPDTDIIIAPSQAPLPEQYMVQLETMTEIADEIIRITGGTGKVTPAQIISALKSM